MTKGMMEPVICNRVMPSSAGVNDLAAMQPICLYLTNCVIQLTNNCSITYS